jgi:hypothetical protein
MEFAPFFEDPSIRKVKCNSLSRSFFFLTPLSGVIRTWVSFLGGTPNPCIFTD